MPEPVVQDCRLAAAFVDTGTHRGPFLGVAGRRVLEQLRSAP